MSNSMLHGAGKATEAGTGLSTRYIDWIVASGARLVRPGVVAHDDENVGRTGRITAGRGAPHDEVLLRRGAAAPRPRQGSARIVAAHRRNGRRIQHYGSACIVAAPVAESLGKETCWGSRWRTVVASPGARSGARMPHGVLSCGRLGWQRRTQADHSPAALESLDAGAAEPRGDAGAVHGIEASRDGDAPRPST